MFRQVSVAWALWWLLWLILYSTAIWLAGFPWGIALGDGSLTVLFLLLGSYATIFALRFYRPGQKSLPNLVAWSAAIAILATEISVWLLKLIFLNEAGYSAFLNNSLLARLSFAFLMVIFTASLSWLWFFLQKQQEDKAREETAHRLARDAELSKLRQQLQPHFLFNSLNSLAALIQTDPARAKTMVHHLSDFFRGTLKKDESQKVPLENEIAQTELYLEIEKVRFGHRLKTEIAMPDNCKSILVPSLLLQPVVENAIKFGLYDTTGEVCISIACSRRNENLEIVVENPFDPDSTTHAKGSGFGLSSIQRRLYLLYARQDLVTTGHRNTTFRVTLTIPQIYA